VALFAWPIVAGVMFARMRLETAAIASLFAGYLLLPSGLSVDLPLLPPIEKSNVTVLSTFLLCLAKGGAPKRGSVGVLLPILAAAYVLAPIGATFANSYELRIGSLSLPGYYFLDGVKGAINNFIQLGAFYIGMRYLSSTTGRAQVLKVSVAAMLLYSLPILVEARLSPQIHRWVYGYAPYSFAEQVRWGGYRPAVFLPQGLMLALLVAMALIAACVLARAKIRVFRLPPWAPAAYLVPILLLCKTLGAVIYAITLVPLAMFARPKTCVKIAAALLIFVCAYPALRTQSLIPVESIVGAAGSVSKDRADSFVVRISNEKLLMEKANQKPVFGWGGWGRNRIYDAWDSKDITITDGGWIIYFGVFGWFGYLGLFGMFAVAAFRANSFIKHAEEQDAKIVSALTLMLAMNIADMLPNANLTPLTFAIAGSIARKVVLARSARKTARLSPPNHRPQSQVAQHVPF
jgi:hypothetical protein